jgi:hypothetical protein
VRVHSYFTIILSGFEADANRNRDIATEAFQKAAEDLRDEICLASKDNATWAESHVNMQDIFATVQRAKREYDVTTKDTSCTREWLEKLSSRVIYYGKVFDCLAQHHPEYVALAWGAMKLVLMVGHCEFFLLIIVAKVKTLGRYQPSHSCSKASSSLCHHWRCSSSSRSKC